MLKRLVGEELVATDDTGEQLASPGAVAHVPGAEAQGELSADAEGNPAEVDSLDTDDVDGEGELFIGDKITDEAADEVVVDTELLYDDEELDESELEEEPHSILHTLFSGDSQAFLLSLIVHTALILTLALVPVLNDKHEPAIVLTELPAAEEPEELRVTEDWPLQKSLRKTWAPTASARPAWRISTASIVADVPNVEDISMEMPIVKPSFDLGSRIQQPSGLVKSEIAVKGMTGVGTTGTDGAVDRITYEILQKMEDKPTLVVWFFDQSVSLMRRRQEIRDRFDRIYTELGLIQESKQGKEKTKLADEPLLTSIFAFGDKVHQLTEKATADMQEIRRIIDSIETDPLGNERVFSAFYRAVEIYKSYRNSNHNVVFIAVTERAGRRCSAWSRTNHSRMSQVLNTGIYHWSARSIRP